MSSFSGLSRMISALNSNQQALNTTAHNLANVETKGYSRQQVIMTDSPYLNKGNNAVTGFQVGLGVDVDTVRQVRDTFLDMSYRNESARQGFYESQVKTIEEIETILGEIEGESFANTLDDLWTSLNEMAKHPDGLETRGTFIQNAVQFVERSNLVMDQLETYQLTLNQEVKDTVDQINTMGKQIHELNEVIVTKELAGGNANDYRDQRNILLNELSNLGDITYKEQLSGEVTVKFENTEFVYSGGVNTMETTEATIRSNLVTPVWSHLSKEIDEDVNGNGLLDSGEDINNDGVLGTYSTKQEVFDFSQEVSTVYDNDKGRLKSLMLSRGTRRGDWTDMDDTLNRDPLRPTTYEEDIQPSIVMNAQAQFDNLVHRVVTLINDVVAPNDGAGALDTANAPYGLDGSQGIEIFKREGMDRYDGANTYNEEDPTNEFSLYTAGRLEINEEVLSDFDKICLSTTKSNTGDTTKIQEMIDGWDSPAIKINPNLNTSLNIKDYYTDYIGEIGSIGKSSANKQTNQMMMLTQIDNERSAISGVSSDEELGYVIQYQHAYNAAAKVVTVLDQMIEQLMNTGLVGR